MNFGTKIRTLLVIATCLNTALMATDITQFGSELANEVYTIASVILNFIVVACATYFNNDYTPAGAIGTSTTRVIKAREKEGFVEEDRRDIEEIMEEGV